VDRSARSASLSIATETRPIGRQCCNGKFMVLRTA